MNYLIFIILILIVVLMYFYCDNKLASAKKQVMIASKQYTIIKTKYDSIAKPTTNFLIKFSNPSSKAGIINSNIYIYLSPALSSPVLKKTDIRMEVQILDMAESDNHKWYYSNLPVDTNINCRGWIKDTDFSILYKESNNLSNLK